MLDLTSPNRRSRPEITTRSNLALIAKSGGVGFILPIVLGIFYGVLFLDNWNIWPAFIIAGSIFGLIIRVITEILLAILHNKIMSEQSLQGSGLRMIPLMNNIFRPPPRPLC